MDPGVGPSVHTLTLGNSKAETPGIRNRFRKLYHCFPLMAILPKTDPATLLRFLLGAYISAHILHKRLIKVHTLSCAGPSRLRIST